MHQIIINLLHILLLLRTFSLNSSDLSFHRPEFLGFILETRQVSKVLGYLDGWCNVLMNSHSAVMNFDLLVSEMSS